jgi:hypothetical protein
VIAVVRAATPGHLLSQVRGFSHPVASPNANLRPVAVALVVVGLAGFAATVAIHRTAGAGRNPSGRAPAGL